MLSSDWTAEEKAKVTQSVYISPWEKIRQRHPSLLKRCPGWSLPKSINAVQQTGCPNLPLQHTAGISYWSPSCQISVRTFACRPAQCPRGSCVWRPSPVPWAQDDNMYVHIHPVWTNTSSFKMTYAAFSCTITQTFRQTLSRTSPSWKGQCWLVWPGRWDQLVTKWPRPLGPDHWTSACGPKMTP